MTLTGVGIGLLFDLMCILTQPSDNDICVGLGKAMCEMCCLLHQPTHWISQCIDLLNIACVDCKTAQKIVNAHVAEMENYESQQRLPNNACETDRGDRYHRNLCKGVCHPLSNNVTFNFADIVCNVNGKKAKQTEDTKDYYASLELK